MKLTELFGSLIFVLVINAVVIAFIMEAVKKGLGDIESKAGKRYIACNIKPVILNITAAILSGIAAFIAYAGEITIGGAPLIVIYAILIYIAQKELDMAIIKKIFNKVIDKILNGI